MASPSPLLLVLDGNSLLHRAYHAASVEGWVDQSGRPVWALRGLVGYLARAAAHLRPDAIVVGFDCPVDSARKADYPGYKAQRAEKPADLAEQILGAPELLRAAGVCTVVPPALEADDVLASSAALAGEHGWRCVLMTSDRDAFALIDGATTVLRVRNGGFDEAVMVDAVGLRAVCGVEPWQYRDYAALRGDPSDNLRGVRQFGAARAARLLAAFGSVDAAWEAIDNGGFAKVCEAVGDIAAEQLAQPGTRELVERNRSLMRMRTDVAMPQLASARLPLQYRVMRQALSARGINFGPSLWALTGLTAPDSDVRHPLEIKPWVYRRGARQPSRIPGQLTLF
ncbi:5'-3' exonuclease [Allorhizocola rhizosphaerae]|uniref:5'-3' exonuclease n=1 Tax=Allorhizocola rhizosphaerae TaxID=1872709 RepID=UPI000E3C0CB2|nr:5'-3' exonuclease H3TH domain-containing protein [Allorhizocola rhizosphaerae]